MKKEYLKYIVEFKSKMNKLCNPYYGEALTDRITQDLEEKITAICLSYVANGVFPKYLWDLDRTVEVEHRASQLCIRVPKWIYVWTLTGEFMSPAEVYEYLEKKDSGVTLIKVWLL